MITRVFSTLRDTKGDCDPRMLVSWIEFHGHGQQKDKEKELPLWGDKVTNQPRDSKPGD